MMMVDSSTKVEIEEDDFDVVNDSVKSNDGSLFRRNVLPIHQLQPSSFGSHL